MRSNKRNTRKRSFKKKQKSIKRGGSDDALRSYFTDFLTTMNRRYEWPGAKYEAIKKFIGFFFNDYDEKITAMDARIKNLESKI